MAEQVPAVSDVLATIERRDWARLERLLDQDVHWTTAIEEHLHGPGELARAWLQIADSTTDLLVLGIAGGVPECPSRIVLEGDQGCDSTGAAAAQVLLTGPRQRDSDALPPMPFPDSEPIHVPPPPVPAGNQGADDLIVAFGNQKSSGGISNQAFDILWPIGRGGVPTSRLSP